MTGRGIAARRQIKVFHGGHEVRDDRSATHLGLFSSPANLVPPVHRPPTPPLPLPIYSLQLHNPITHSLLIILIFLDGVNFGESGKRRAFNSFYFLIPNKINNDFSEGVRERGRARDAHRGGDTSRTITVSPR